jgi:PAS domain S-box-containing protein
MSSARLPSEAEKGNDSLPTASMLKKDEIISILESINDGFFAFDREWRYTYINHRAAEPLGYQPEELIGKNLWEIFPKMRGTIAEEHYRKALEEGIHSHYRVQGVYSQRWYDINVYPSENGISVYSVDRTEQIESDMELREREILLRLALEGTQQGVWDWNLKTNILTWDNRCKEIFGLPFGMSPTYEWSIQALHTDDRQHVRDVMTTAIKEKKNIEIECRILWPDGTMKWVMVRGRPYFNEDGEAHRMLGTVMDITQQKQIEAEKLEYRMQMEVQHRLLEYREKERQDIARDLHDGPVQNLSSLLFNIQYTKETAQDPNMKLELEQISQGLKDTIRELREMINEFRPPSLIRFGLTKAIEFHSEDFREKHPGLCMILTLTDDGLQLSEQVRLGLFRIYQEGMNNILHHSNAAKAWVRFTMEKGQAILEIRDNGHGFQVDSDLTQQTLKGHFGMAGMQERAEAIGGTFRIASEPGFGTVIQVAVPLDRNKFII